MNPLLLLGLIAVGFIGLVLLFMRISIWYIDNHSNVHMGLKKSQRRSKK